MSYSLRLCELGNWTLQSPHALILLPNGFSHAIILQHPPTSSTPAPSPKQGSCPAAPLPQEVVKTVDPRLCCCAPADAPKCRYVTDSMWVLAPSPTGGRATDRCLSRSTARSIARPALHAFGQAPVVVAKLAPHISRRHSSSVLQAFWQRKVSCSQGAW